MRYNLAMIMAIIFDCFGVLAVDGWQSYKNKHFVGKPELLGKARELNRRSDSGQMAYDDFIRQVAQMAGTSEAEFRKSMEGMEMDEALLDYIAAELKPHYKIGMLSNVANDWLNARLLNRHKKLFDAITLSIKTGFVKPDERAYEAALIELGESAENCVFVDDQERNCTAAREVGMQAILYEDLPQLRSELDAILTKQH